MQRFQLCFFYVITAFILALHPNILSAEEVAKPHTVTMIGSEVTQLTPVGKESLLYQLEASVIPEPIPAPIDVAFKNEKGEEVTLKSLRGNVVLLHFWATWCVPCVEELPRLSDLQAYFQYHNLPAVIIPVSIDYKDIDAIGTFYKDHKISNLNIYKDTHMALYKAANVKAGLPVTIIINPLGHEEARLTGSIHWEYQETRDFIGRFFPASPLPNTANIPAPTPKQAPIAPALPTPPAQLTAPSSTGAISTQSLAPIQVNTTSQQPSSTKEPYFPSNAITAIPETPKF